MSNAFNDPFVEIVCNFPECNTILQSLIMMLDWSTEITKEAIFMGIWWRVCVQGKENILPVEGKLIKNYTKSGKCCDCFWVTSTSAYRWVASIEGYQRWNVPDACWNWAVGASLFCTLYAGPAKKKHTSCVPVMSFYKISNGTLTNIFSCWKLQTTFVNRTSDFVQWSNIYVQCTLKFLAALLTNKRLEG